MPCFNLQFKVAEQFSQLMRQYPTAIPTAYPGDTGADWTHLILTYVIQVLYNAPSFMVTQLCSPTPAHRSQHGDWQ